MPLKKEMPRKRRDKNDDLGSVVNIHTNVKGTDSFTLNKDDMMALVKKC